MKRATIDVYLVMNQELTTVSIDFIFFLNYAIFQTYLLFYFSLLHVTLKNVDFFLVKTRQDSCTENLSILIGVCVVLCISVVVNGCTITWILRHNWCKQRDVTRQKTTGDSHSNDFVLQQGIYETTEDNAGYQELGQVSEPSHYDQLRT